MKYSELIELYKNGKLPDNEKEKVENDIERQTAISEYLYENEKIPEFEDLDISSDMNSVNEETDEQEKFLKMIKSSIRKAFIKSGIIVSAIVLAICLFIIFALPKLTNNFYYNPSEIINGENELSTNRISLDIMAYTELFVPGYFRCNVDSDANGYGEHDINIRQISSYTGLFTNVSGKIEQGKLHLYDNNLLKRPTGDAFMPTDEMLSDMHAGMGPAGTSEESFEELDELDDNDYYIAYVTLDKVLSYDEFVEWSKENGADPTWCAICQESDDELYELTNGYFSEELIGFIYSNSCSQMVYDKEKYPYLTYFDTTTTAVDNDWIISNDVMQTHVTSLLRYLEDQKEFKEMMEIDYEDGYFSDIADNIEENGLNIYGYVTIGQKEDLIKLKDMDGLEYVYTQLLR